MEHTNRLVDTITKGIKEKKGQRITIVDLGGIEGAIARYFGIGQGNSPSQVEAIAESVGDTVRTVIGEKPINIVGLGLSQWVAIDYADVLVHIFVPETRSYYDLENLWDDAKLTRLPDIG